MGELVEVVEPQEPEEEEELMMIFQEEEEVQRMTSPTLQRVRTHDCFSLEIL